MSICVNKQFYGIPFSINDLSELKSFIENIILLLNSHDFESDTKNSIKAFNYKLNLDNNGEYQQSNITNAYEIKGIKNTLIFYCFLIEVNEEQHQWIFDIKYEGGYNLIENENLRLEILNQFTSLFDI